MLIEKYNAVAADWESGAIAWVAKKNNTRVLILRGVSDLVDDSGGEAYGNLDTLPRAHKNCDEKIVRSTLESISLLMDFFLPNIRQQSKCEDFVLP